MNGPPDAASSEQAAPPALPAGAGAPRLRALGSVVMAAAGFLAGLVLLVYPWLEWWDENLFSAWLPLWSSGYLRGAIAGLGAVDLVLSLSSMARLRRR